ncbi:MAG: hypothetical protein D6781_01425, partial [Verrucomicrobia bacterium]
MKIFTAKQQQTEASPPIVALARGDVFFMRRFELPAGLAPGEVSGFVELQLEELSPFPLDQLLHGRVVADGAVFVYAAYRRRFTAEELQAWEQLRFVLPEFAG